jgi:hypothetical protein
MQLDLQLIQELISFSPLSDKIVTRQAAKNAGKRSSLVYGDEECNATGHTSALMHKVKARAKRLRWQAQGEGESQDAEGFRIAGTNVAEDTTSCFCRPRFPIGSRSSMLRRSSLAPIHNVAVDHMRRF